MASSRLVPKPGTRVKKKRQTREEQRYRQTNTTDLFRRSVFQRGGLAAEVWGESGQDESLHTGFDTGVLYQRQTRWRRRASGTPADPGPAPLKTQMEALQKGIDRYEIARSSGDFSMQDQVFAGQAKQALKRLTRQRDEVYEKIAQGRTLSKHEEDLKEQFGKAEDYNKWYRAKYDADAQPETEDGLIRHGRKVDAEALRKRAIAAVAGEDGKILSPQEEIRRARAERAELERTGQIATEAGQKRLEELKGTGSFNKRIEALQEALSEFDKVEDLTPNDEITKRQIQQELASYEQARDRVFEDREGAGKTRRFSDDWFTRFGGNEALASWQEQRAGAQEAAAVKAPDYVHPVEDPLVQGMEAALGRVFDAAGEGGLSAEAWQEWSESSKTFSDAVDIFSRHGGSEMGEALQAFAHVLNRGGEGYGWGKVEELFSKTYGETRMQQELGEGETPSDIGARILYETSRRSQAGRQVDEALKLLRGSVTEDTFSPRNRSAWLRLQGSRDDSFLSQFLEGVGGTRAGTAATEFMDAMTHGNEDMNWDILSDRIEGFYGADVSNADPWAFATEFDDRQVMGAMLAETGRRRRARR